ALQFRELLDVLRRQRLRDGGEKLRHLHDRAFQAAERGRKLSRVLRPIEIEPKETRAGEPRRDAADIGAHPRIALGAGGEAVLFAVGHELRAYLCVTNRKYAFPGRTPDVRVVEDARFATEH